MTYDEMATALGQIRLSAQVCANTTARLVPFTRTTSSNENVFALAESLGWTAYRAFDKQYKEVHITSNFGHAFMFFANPNSKEAQEYKQHCVFVTEHVANLNS